MPKELVCVGVYSTTELAHAARFALDAEGIPSYLDNEWVSSLIWTLTDTVGGVKLLVDSSDAKVAAEILKNPVGPAELKAEFNQAAGDFAQKNSTGEHSLLEELITVNEREDSSKRAFRGAIIGLFIPPIQFFTVYLLAFHVLLGKGKLSSKYKIQAWVAAAISVPYILVILLFVRLIIRGSI
jgi:hypothetical protein